MFMCSLKCCQRHKQETKCNGKRRRSEHAPRVSDMNDKTILQGACLPQCPHPVDRQTQFRSNTARAHKHTHTQRERERRARAREVNQATTVHTRGQLPSQCRQLPYTTVLHCTRVRVYTAKGQLQRRALPRTPLLLLPAACTREQGRELGTHATRLGGVTPPDSAALRHRACYWHLRLCRVGRSILITIVIHTADYYLMEDGNRFLGASNRGMVTDNKRRKQQYSNRVLSRALPHFRVLACLHMRSSYLVHRTCPDPCNP